MIHRFIAAVAACCLGAGPAVASAPDVAPAVQRIIVIRHGEKPEAGLGQLSCRGLARALALPDVIVPKYGMPHALFAPNPGVSKRDRGHLYNYIRPLATVEPLAIRAGLPVDVRFGFDKAMLVARALEAPQYASQFIVVAWEHNLATPMVREILRRAGADPRQVENWKDDDFDRMDIVEITRKPGHKPVATYFRGRQGLDGLSNECPRINVP